jgi:peptidoglycan/xylan/chitin deacetylase (PgdA/CDA1 family)
MNESSSGDGRSSASGRLAILGYHNIGEPRDGARRTWFYVPEDLFAHHLRVLGEGGWNVLDAPTFVQGLADPSAWPERSALITFDDGKRNVLHVALPHLRRRGYPAVLFVPTGFIGGKSTFDGGEEPEEPICTWRELQELEQAGVSIQSHGVTHRGFSSLSPEEQLHELEESKSTLEEGLGKRVDLFAFPFGDGGVGPGQSPKLPGRAGYRASCLYRGAPLPFSAGQPLPDPHRLPRLAVGPDTNIQTELDR